MEETKTFRKLKELTDEIRAVIKELDEAASRSEVFVESDYESFGSSQVNVGPRKLSFNRERAALDKLIALYQKRAKYEE